eukprot:CAMPEP_0180655512 /NCGR_PEP_ID=MMETSP1037_2-20121125/55314_1 /TAXON_ID=632150 /ORGANISM="Azadinium spinosum, Strain 3D9" /LENGTH=48 /DNA_ID= /DNA_START= /DNA_END= /DNA_ORIENTATION=
MSTSSTTWARNKPPAGKCAAASTPNPASTMGQHQTAMRFGSARRNEPK